MKPFLKWAGGKRWLLEKFKPNFPKTFDNYIEPFVGGGSVFFKLQPNRGILSDTNGNLINAYDMVKEQPEQLYELLKKHHRKHSTQYYYDQRTKSHSNNLMRAAQFIYLNRTCWNGLYRENLKGQFNVPIGTKNTVIFPDDDFTEWSRVLNNVELNCSDFEINIAKAKSGDLIFADPPYAEKIVNPDKFIKYGKKIFTWDDQVRLAESLVNASKNGAFVVVTNKLTEDIEELYTSFPNSWKVSRTSLISGNAAFRGNYGEFICANFNLFAEPNLRQSG